MVKEGHFLSLLLHGEGYLWQHTLSLKKPPPSSSGHFSCIAKPEKGCFWTFCHFCILMHIYIMHTSVAFCASVYTYMLISCYEEMCQGNNPQTTATTSTSHLFMVGASWQCRLVNIHGPMKVSYYQCGIWAGFHFLHHSTDEKSNIVRVGCSFRPCCRFYYTRRRCDRKPWLLQIFRKVATFASFFATKLSGSPLPSKKQVKFQNSATDTNT